MTKFDNLLTYLNEDWRLNALRQRMAKDNAKKKVPQISEEEAYQTIKDYVTGPQTVGSLIHDLEWDPIDNVIGQILSDVGYPTRSEKYGLLVRKVFKDLAETGQNTGFMNAIHKKRERVKNRFSTPIRRF